MWAAETGFGSRTDQKLFWPPSSIVLDAHSIVSIAAVGETPPFDNDYKRFKSVLA